MASTSLCFSGFGRDDLAKIQEQFEQANAKLGFRWTLAPEAEAGVLVIDMDSMYGHMTWLKAASSGRSTVGLTAGERCETDYLLRRPVSVEALQSLLSEIASGSPAPAAAPVAPAAPEPEMLEVVAAPSPSADYIAAITTGQMAAMPAHVVPHQPSISDFMAPGVLSGPVRLSLPGAPVLLLDPASQGYAGSAQLKPLVPYVQAVLEPGDAEAVGPADFAQAQSGAGGTQPWMRLLWLCGLVTGQGQLIAGFSAAKKFQLTKWPQIEREFPKHFRIATVMMKGPAFIKDIAESSGATAAEVTDFVNAGLVSGAVVVEGSAPVGGDPARASALLARPHAG